LRIPNASVESCREQQFGVLRAAGVALVQGELFGRPCPVSDLVIDDVVVLCMVESAA
jgi:EAL domain-containing protein (putative c-di-GMP-specific phosphodiesterase class I)